MTIVEKLRARKGYLSTAELMDTLGVCRKTLTRWVNAGRIPATRVGNANRYDPAHVIAYLEARQIGPNA